MTDTREPMAYNKFLELITTQFPHARVSIASNGEIIIGTFWEMKQSAAVPMVLDESMVGNPEGIPEWQHMLGASLYSGGERVKATLSSRGIRAGAVGKVESVDRGDGYVLVEWEDSQSGPIWHRPHEIHKANG